MALQTIPTVSLRDYFFFYSTLNAYFGLEFVAIHTLLDQTKAQEPGESVQRALLIWTKKLTKMHH